MSRAWRLGQRCGAALICAVLLAPLPARAAIDAPEDGSEGARRSVDTDGDGVSDAEERVLGLDPTSVNVPEPLLFDMVRGLGAKRGEHEINTLVRARAPASADAPGELDAGLEVELVPVDGLGLEIEACFSASASCGLRAGVQLTLPSPAERTFVHGLLFGGQLLHGPPGIEGTLMYVGGVRFNPRWSILAMGGVGLSHRRGGPAKPVFLVNPSVYFDASPRLTLGVELDGLLDLDGTRDLVVLPQVHFQPTRSFKLQLGAGPQIDETGASVLFALRTSWMF